MDFIKIAEEAFGSGKYRTRRQGFAGRADRLNHIILQYGIPPQNIP